jgi:hypothetical protein
MTKLFIASLCLEAFDTGTMPDVRGSVTRKTLGGHTESGASYDRSREGWQKDQQKTLKKLRREEVRHRTLFVIEVMFDDLDDAMMARRELIAAGYDFRIVPEVDEFSNAVFTEVARSTCAGLDEDALWKQVQDIVAPMRGGVDCGGLIEGPIRERHMHRLQ